MSKRSTLAAEYGSQLKASLRLAGFFGLILVLVPAQALFRQLRPDKPFMVSQLFYRSLSKVMGFRLRTYGTMATAAPVLFVSNHTSYLDIPVLGALIPAAFVAKADVARWPLIGALAKIQNTVFIERRSSQISNQKTYLQSHLAKRRSLILFPEGTSSDGQTVLPFKSALFSIVEEEVKDITITVQPVSVTCSGLDGLPMTRGWRSFYSWFGDMTLVPHLWNMFSLGDFTIDIVFHTPVSPSDFPNRKALAQHCQATVAMGVEHCLTGRLQTPGHALEYLSASPTHALSSTAHDHT